MTLCVIYKT